MDGDRAKAAIPRNHRIRWLHLGLFISLLVSACTTINLGQSLGEPFPAQIHTATLVDDTTFELEVVNNPCQRLEGWSEEGDDSVTIGVWAQSIESGDSTADRQCAETVGLDTVTINLAEPFGERDLIVSHVNRGFLPEDFVCFRIVGKDQCQRLTVRNEDGDHVMAAEPVPNATDIRIGPGGPTILTVDGSLVELTTTDELIDPIFSYSYSLWEPTIDVWGTVTVHNLDRDFTDVKPLDGLVNGHEAFLVRHHEDEPNDPEHLTISVGPWWVDVLLWTGDPALHAERQSELLAGLSISERVGDLPLIEDKTGWLRPYGGLGVQARPLGFGIGVYPNCDPATEVGCIEGVGWISPIGDITGDVLGVVPDPDPQEYVLPADLTMSIVEFGPRGELVSCEGFPAFDPLLLSKEMALWDATVETGTYTGIEEWAIRYQPGIETWFVGDPDNPDTVATYVRNDDGTWNTESVLTCQ